MKLDPKRPAGRPNRKALFFEGEIARLRAEGYPCEAIWEALLDAGLSLSLSAVKREVSRLRKSTGAARRSAPATTFTPPQASAFCSASHLARKQVFFAVRQGGRRRLDEGPRH